MTRWKCECGQWNHPARDNCRQCNAPHPLLVVSRLSEQPPKPPKRKPRRGTVEYWQREQAHARKMADVWANKALTAVNKLHEWHRRERRMAMLISLGPQPPRPKRERPKRRAIALPKGRAQ